MTPTRPGTGDDDVTTELPVTGADTTSKTGETARTPTRAARPRKDVYRRRRETAAAVLFAAGGILIWSQISDTISTFFRR